MATSVPITTNAVTVTDNGSTVDVAVTQTAVSVNVGTTGPQGATGPAVPLSSSTPQPTGAAGAAGSGTSASKDDHVHALATHDHSSSTTGGNIPQSSVTDLVSSLAGKAAIQAIAFRNKVGAFYHCGVGARTATQITLNRLCYTPIWLPAGFTADRIGAEVTIAGAAGSVVRLGIYSAGTDGRPSALILDAGTIDGASATVQQITINQSLSAGGLYFLAAVVQSSGTNPTVRALAGQHLPGFASVTSGGATAELGYNEAGISGALPSTPGSLSGNGFAPVVFLRSA